MEDGGQVKSGIGFSGKKCRSRPAPSVTIRAQSFHPFRPNLFCSNIEFEQVISEAAFAEEEGRLSLFFDRY